MTRRSLAVVVAALLAVPMIGALMPQPVGAIPNPVATNEEDYQAFGRVFPDPHGCLAYNTSDSDGDGIKDTPRGVSPWAKGRACADQFLSYEEVLSGAKFLSRRFPEFVDVLKVSQITGKVARSAGIPRTVSFEGGKVQVLGRDPRPLYLFKVTNATSPIPERDRKHFVYSLSIHGIERAGLEGGARAMEDLTTWAACELEKYADNTPACAVEGPFPKKIIETPSKRPAPTAGEALERSVVYFILPNPDGWARGQVAPIEVENGQVNASYMPGFFFQRYNGNGVDLNRDWPTIGYTFKPYSPASEPESRAFSEALLKIKKRTSAGRFSGGIDLHGMVTAHAFSYTLIGSGQRDYRKNALTVDTSIRTWEDQTQRMSWSPYVADSNANGAADDGEVCTGEGLDVPNVYGGGTRGRIPACVADEWGTVIDTIGYQITGGVGDWIDSPLGLDAVGIDNEMYASHLAPNTVFDPALEQTHIDGNKGLIYSQLASMLESGAVRYVPGGRTGYVFNPNRLKISENRRVTHPELPTQHPINVLLPCQGVEGDAPTGCQSGEFVNDGGSPTYEFDVKGPKQGYWNGGLYVTLTRPNVSGVGDGNVFSAQLQHFDEGQWHTVASDFNQSFLYGQAGAVVTVNDPQPGRWRVWFEAPSQIPARVRIVFRKSSAEKSSGQMPINASSMDFFTELNKYVPDASDLDRVTLQDVVRNPASLRKLDSLILVNDIGSPGYLKSNLGLSPKEVDRFFSGLRSFARGGGNLVLTDGALRALPELGLGIPAGAVGHGNTLAGSYFFQISDDVLTYKEPDRFPLAEDVGLPGAAEQEVGRRQAAEPTPLGYSPDPGYDTDPAMPYWGVNAEAWTKACGVKDCVTALSNPIEGGPAVSLGEARLGKGRVRVAGIMFPDPVFAPDEANDHRFGLASYALTYTAYEVFENLIAFRR